MTQQDTSLETGNPSVSRPSLTSLRATLAATSRPEEVPPRPGRRDALVLAGLATLPPTSVDLLLLTAVGGYSMREAAALAGCTTADAYRWSLDAIRILGELTGTAAGA